MLLPSVTDEHEARGHFVRVINERRTHLDNEEFEVKGESYRKAKGPDGFPHP